MSKIQIVLSTYNGEAYLREQLDSLFQNTYQDFTIEICDDNSTDGTLMIVKEYQITYPDRISIHENDKNVGYVMNFLEGMRRSDSEYIMFCDQDDIWHKDKIELTLRYMEQLENGDKTKPTLVFTDALLYDNESGETRGTFLESSHFDLSKTDVPHILMENKCIGCTIMCNHAICDYLQDIPENIRVHDWWLALICSTFGNIGCFQKPTLLYRQHGGNMIGGTSFSSYVKNRLQSLREQKKAIMACYLQGEAFYHCFEHQLDEEAKRKIKKFYEMKNANWFVKRYRILHYGYCKSGLSRNVGLFLIV